MESPQISYQVLAIAGTVVGGSFALAKMAFDLVKSQIAKRSPAFKESVLTEMEREQLTLLTKLHSKTDSNGVPVWYVPRVWGRHLESLGTVLKEVETGIGASAKAIEKVCESMEDHRREEAVAHGAIEKDHASILKGINNKGG